VDIAPDFDSIVGAVVGDKPTGVRMINRLRARLQEITDSGHDWPSMIVALRSKYPHSIREVHPTKSGRYNCFAYALGLYQSAAYLKIAKNSRSNIFANAAFVSHLIFEGVLRPTDLAAPRQKIIVYFRDGAPNTLGWSTNSALPQNGATVSSSSMRCSKSR
jgi:hypothetical protein